MGSTAEPIFGARAKAERPWNEGMVKDSWASRVDGAGAAEPRIYKVYPIRKVSRNGASLLIDVVAFVMNYSYSEYEDVDYRCD